MAEEELRGAWPFIIRVLTRATTSNSVVQEEPEDKRD